MQVRLLADRWIWGLLLFELPAVLLLPAIVLCEAVGDRRRGFLAVAGLAGFQFGVPFTLVLVDEFLGGSTAAWVPVRSPSWLFAGAYLVALVGSTAAARAPARPRRRPGSEA